MNALKLAVIAAAAIIWVVACGENPTKPATNSPATTPAAAASPVVAADPGKELYAANCQICHQDTGKGGRVTVDGKNLKPIDLTSDKMKKHDDAKLADHISEGAPDDGMPAFKDKLKPDEIKQIVQYIRKLQTPPANS